MKDAGNNMKSAEAPPELPGGAAGLAHDLKSWLTPVRTCLQLWENGERGKAEALRGAAMESLKLIMACLEQMRPGSRASLSGLSVVALAGLLGRAASLSRPLVQSKELSVTVNVPAGLSVRADEILLLRLLANLLSNAAQAAPVGGAIELRGEPAAERPGWVKINVSNPCAEAPEMPAAVGEETPQRWGIGLRICREIAALHGGQMDLQSTDTPPAITVSILLPGVD